MSIVQIILATLVTLGLLVTIHEFGHFWVARRCGVKVLKFSVGFGRALWSRYDRHGTEFVVAAIPLGGYVKMLDEREEPVATEQLHQAFNRQSVGKRIAIVVAGPAANFIFAVFTYWLLFVLGVHTVVPVVGEVKPNSIAAEAGVPQGHEIISVNGAKTQTWQDINIRLLGFVGETGEVAITTRALAGEIPKTTQLSVQDWLQGVEHPDPLADLGIAPYTPPIPTVVGRIIEGSAAERAGLQVSDRILSIQSQALPDWQSFVVQIKAYPLIPVALEIERGSERLTLTAVPDAQQLESGEVVGYLGIGPQRFEWPQELRRTISYSVLGAWWPALEKTWDMTVLTLESLKKMLVGMISIKNLSGPITIAKVAGASVDKGIEPFLNFLAYLSISLGLINILPIPVLDGGHLMYYLVELVRGKPVSEKVQLLGLKIGMSIIFAVMILALYNDLARF